MSLYPGHAPEEIGIEPLGQPDGRVLGTIVNISQGVAHIKISRFFRPGSVRVWFSENCHVDGQLIFCRTEKQAYLASVHFTPDPEHRRRSGLRIPLTNQLATVYSLEGDTQAKYEAQAVDISRSGLGLLMRQNLTVKTWIKVELGFAIVFGEVMYSRPDVTKGAYRVGLRTETLLMRAGVPVPEFLMTDDPPLAE